MTVSTTTFTAGGNSKKVSISNEIGNGSTNVISAVDSAITSLGWTQWDVVAATTYNPIRTYVYRVLNADGVTYKYFILRWDTIKLIFYSSTCEYWWNNFLHQPVNESWTNAGAFGQGYDLVNSFIIVAATARHLILWNNINNQAGLWAGVLEYERVAAEDTAIALQPAGSNSYSPILSGSLYFGGTNYINSATSVTAAGNFTVECWIYPTTTGTCTFFCIGNEAAGRINFFTSGGNLQYNIFGSGAITLSTNTITTYAWQHVAIVCNNGTITGYVNGNVGTTPSFATTGPYGNTGGFYVMSVSTGAQGIGYVSNLRYVNTTALYTSNFTQPNAQLTPVSGTQVLLNSSPAAPFKDNSTNNNTYTNTGGVVAYAFSPFLTQYSYGPNKPTGNIALTALSTNVSVYTTGFVANTSTPCYAWTNSLMMGTPWGQAIPTTTRSPYMFAPPRTADGSIGTNATSVLTTVTNRGPMPPTAAYGTLAYTQDNNYLHLGTYGNTQIAANLVYGWDSTKTPITTISVDALSAPWSMPNGRIYNVGTGRGLGNVNVPDTTLANVDSTNGWVSSAGAQTEVLLLPLNGGNESTNLYSPSQFSQIFANVGASIIAVKSIAIGDTIFTATGPGTTGQGGIITTQISAGNVATPTFRANILGGVYDLLFDGNGYVWGSTTSGLVQMNVNTFSTVVYSTAGTTANGCGYLAMDNHNIYVSGRVKNIKPQVSVFDRVAQTFTNVIETTTAFTAASNWGTPVPDYTGNVYLFQTPGTGAATSLYMQLNSNTANYTTVNSSLGAGQGAINYGHTGFYDPITQRSWEFSATSTSFLQVAELWSGNLTQKTAPVLNFAWGTSPTIQGTLLPTSTPGAVDLQGDLYIVPWRGHYYIGVKKPGLVNHTTANSYATIGSLLHPLGPGTSGGAYYITSPLTVTISTAPYGTGSWATTNTISLFDTWGQNAAAAPVNESRVYVVNGLFTANSSIGGNTGRLMLRG